jgi:hypothetical protein
VSASQERDTELHAARDRLLAMLTAGRSPLRQPVFRLCPRGDLHAPDLIDR